MPKGRIRKGDTEDSTRDSKIDETLERYENSVVSISVRSKRYSYDTPWLPPEPTRWSGSGFVMEFEGHVFLITNAHVADSADLIDIRFPDDDEKYAAKTKFIDHDCDLAALEIKDPSFWSKAKPLKIGSMPPVKSKLNIYGFPTAGKEFCITEGQVSRIEQGDYCESGVTFLQMQVTAAIHPGNSGGPAIHNGEVLGVAFQGRDGQGQGFIIPPAILSHFLKDSLISESYYGFPDLAIEWQSLEDKRQRQYFGMHERTGIRIKKINPLCSSYGILKKNDILLSMDGQLIKNDGTVDCDFSKRLTFQHLIQTKQIGESISATVLRDGEEFQLTIPLLNRENTTYLTSRESEKPPTYYIHSGLVFVPGTDNYVDEVAEFGDNTLTNLQRKNKKLLDQGFVSLSAVLASKITRTLVDEGDRVIKKINGIRIHNIREAIDALEGNKDRNHILEAKDGEIFVAYNMSKERNDKLLKKHKIFADRSDDLMSEPVYLPGTPEANALFPAFNRFKQKKNQTVQPSETIERNTKLAAR